MKILIRACTLFLILTMITGVLYPLSTTVLAQLFFKDAANGSLIVEGDKVVGAKYLGQNYTDEKHMWGRVTKLDFTTYQDDQGNPLVYAGPSNLSPLSDDLDQLVEERIKLIEAAHPDQKGVAIPVDLVTNSGSGLDPHISLKAANYQIKRLALANNVSDQVIVDIINEAKTERFLGLFGEEVVNVLEVNLKIDQINQ